MKHKLNTTNQRGEVNLLVVACAVLGVFVLVFVGLFINSYLKEQKATKDVNAQKAVAYKLGQQAGANAQKQIDAAVSKNAAENPYRSYTAPTSYGNFTIKFPKNWSSSVAESLNATNQVDLIVNPEFIKVVTDNSANYALRVTLVDTPYENLRSNYDQQVKSKKAKASGARLSGISGMRYTGAYAQGKDGIAVLIPVRDKTMVFVTDNTKYQAEFEATLSQSTIKP